MSSHGLIHKRKMRACERKLFPSLLVNAPAMVATVAGMDGVNGIRCAKVALSFEGVFVGLDVEDEAGEVEAVEAVVNAVPDAFAPGAVDSGTRGRWLGRLLCKALA